MSGDSLWFVKRIHLFRSLDREALDKLGTMAVQRTYQRRQLIFGPEDPGDTVYLVQKGRVKLSRFDDNGKEITLAILEEGELFGEEALAGGDRRKAYAEALDEVKLLRLERRAFEGLMTEHPELALSVARHMSERLLGAHAQIEALAFRDVPERLAGALVYLTERYGQGEDTSGRRRIHLRLTHQELANLIASTRETTTSLLNRFKRDGLLEQEGRFLVVCDLEGLRLAARLP